MYLTNHENRPIISLGDSMTKIDEISTPKKVVGLLEKVVNNTCILEGKIFKPNAATPQRYMSEARRSLQLIDEYLDEIRGSAPEIEKAFCKGEVSHDFVVMVHERITEAMKALSKRVVPKLLASDAEYPQTRNITAEAITAATQCIAHCAAIREELGEIAQEKITEDSEKAAATAALDEEDEVPVQ